MLQWTIKWSIFTYSLLLIKNIFVILSSSRLGGLSRLFPLVAILTGCTQKAEQFEAPVTLPAAYSSTGFETIPGNWWESFNSPKLDNWVEAALSDNFNILAAWQRLREAQALADRESSRRLPSLDARATAETQNPDFTSGDRLSFGLSAGYEIDLWGRIQSSAQAEALRAEATAFDAQTVMLTISAEVVRTVLEAVVARDQSALLEEQLAANKQVLGLLENRFGSGQTRRVDLLRQMQLVESTREQLLDITSRVRILDNQLAALVGRAPGETLRPLPEELPDLPALPNVGVPAGLVQRRPDLRAAQARLMAADRDLAAAIADRFPRLSLTASASTEDNDSSDLFDDWIRNLAASLFLPVIDGGERRAEKNRVQAVRQRLIYDYGRVVLEAVREVEDALILEAAQARRLESLQEQVRLAGASLEQLRREYANGVSDYLDVLTALTDEQRLRRELLTARLARVDFRIALYRALAGAPSENMETR